MANWSATSRESLNKARERIAEVANAGTKDIASSFVPNVKKLTPAGKAQWQDCLDAANAAKGKTSDYNFVIWPSDDGKTLTDKPKLPKKWPYDYKKNIQEVYGPFRVPLKVGDVPAGSNIYIYFYSGVP